MEALDLEPAGYSGTYKLVGGRVALDFLNTLSWPGRDRRHDWFAPPSNIGAWLAAVGLRRVDVSSHERARIVTLRSSLDAAIRPLAYGRRPPKPAAATLSDLVRGALSRRHIDPVSLTWRYDPPARAIHAFDPVVLDAAAIVTDGRHDRLRHCPSCDWLFEDRSRNGQRRWCDMADCGSRHKARAYYHRTKL